jgi:hypothetical protein
MDDKAIELERDRLKSQRDELLKALQWIADIAEKQYAQDKNLRAQGARTLKRVFDRATTAIEATRS